MNEVMGRIVRSKSGHDKGKFYVVLYAADNEVYLSDGRLKPIAKPKRKNIKHISITNTFMDMNGKTDKDISNILIKFDDTVTQGGK